MAAGEEEVEIGKFKHYLSEDVGRFSPRIHFDLVRRVFDRAFSLSSSNGITPIPSTTTNTAYQIGGTKAWNTHKS
jgi:hypothetical protein